MKSSVSSPFRYARRRSSVVHIGDVPLGGDYPIRVQSMASVSTMATEEATAQAIRVLDAGASYLRFTAQGVKEATNLGVIRSELSSRGYTAPLIADIHFSPKAADVALEQVEKVRINPGNYVDTKSSTPRDWDADMLKEARAKVEERFGAFVDRAEELGRAIRVGVNHGSLSERMVTLYGDTPEGMVQSALEYLDVCRSRGFGDVVISMKASNVLVMTTAVRLLSERLEALGYPAYPLHLGVTEAGEGEDGRIKSAVGIGSLLYDGLGDTLRVSLSEDPELEIPVGRTLIDYVTSQQPLPEELLKDAPSWEEYDALRQSARLSAQRVGGVIGGGLTPIVLQALADYDSESEPRADYLVGDDGRLLDQQGGVVEGARLRAIRLENLSEKLLQELKDSEGVILSLEAVGDSPVYQWRWMLYRLRAFGVSLPVVLSRRYEADNIEDFRLQASVDAGTILLDGWANGLYLSAPKIEASKVVATQLGILQATRLRMSKTEFISCPGCGRTLYNLQDTIARIKARTSHLKGLKIGIMGCIVNGPGEMADADYGYVGAAPGQIDLYKGQACIRRGIPQEQAVEALIELIKSEGDWHEPESNEDTNH